MKDILEAGKQVPAEVEATPSLQNALSHPIAAITMALYDTARDLVAKDKIPYTQAMEKVFQDTFGLNFQELVADSSYCFVHCEDGNASNDDSDDNITPDMEPELIALTSKMLGGINMGSQQYKQFQQWLEEVAQALKGTVDD